MQTQRQLCICVYLATPLPSIISRLWLDICFTHIGYQTPRKIFITEHVLNKYPLTERKQAE